VYGLSIANLFLVIKDFLSKNIEESLNRETENAIYTSI
jgi:hypothetical protein